MLNSNSIDGEYGIYYNEPMAPVVPKPESKSKIPGSGPGSGSGSGWLAPNDDNDNDPPNVSGKPPNKPDGSQEGNGNG